MRAHSIKLLKPNSWWLSGSCVLLLTILVMAPSINGAQFLNWDDDRFIVNNPRVQSLSLENIVNSFEGLIFESYQPLHLVSYMIDAELWSGHPVGYRIHNLLLYVGAVILLFWLLKRIGIGPYPAAIGCLIFALAPYRVESVAWITGRKDVLMLFLALGSWHMHLSAQKGDRIRWGKQLGGTLLFVAALLSKSSAFVLPVMVFIVDVVFLERPLRKTLFAILPMALCATGIAVALPMIWSQANLVRPPISPGMGGRLGLIGWTLGHYIYTLIWPFQTTPLYAEPSREQLLQGMVFGYGSLLALTLVFFILRRKKKPIKRPLGVVLIFLLGMAPFLNVVPLYFLVADRYLLVPSIGLALGVGFFCHAVENKKFLFQVSNRMVLKNAVRLFFVALILIYAATTTSEASAWKTSEDLWQHAVRRQPESFFAWVKLGETLRNEKRPAESAQAYRRAQKIRPLSPIALGGIFWAALLMDAAHIPELSESIAKDLTFQFANMANDRNKLLNFARDLKRRGCIKASQVVLGRIYSPTAQ